MTNKMTADERNDAERLHKAIQALDESDLSTARELLEQVVANSPAPSDYVYKYQEGEREVIRFWSKNEFICYVTYLSEAADRGEEQPVGAINWIPSVYPCAYYYLAMIGVEEGEDQRALSHLEASLELEPDQPLSLCEMALIYSRMGQRERALRCYDKALETRPHITARARARALRGKAFELIELGWLDQAEAYLKESLQYEPTSQMARGELAYIAHLRAGSPRLPAQLTAYNSQPGACAICGNELGKECKAAYIEGKVAYVCSKCAKKKSKRWWEFWK